MKIIMLGAPGAGKGTQAKKISDEYKVPHISTGDIFRQHIKAETELGKKAKGYMDQGLLVPDELVVDLVIARLSEDDCQDGYILDGFPRTVPQAKALDESITEQSMEIEYVINIEIQDEAIIKRMGGRRACINCGATYHIDYQPTKIEGVCDSCDGETVLRSDDAPETVKKRLEIYHNETSPLIEYYSAKDVLVNVDGTLGLENVYQAIRTELNSK